METGIFKKLLYVIGSRMSAMNKKELLQLLAMGAGLTKHAVIRMYTVVTKGILIVILFGAGKEKTIETIATNAKLSKADASRALDAVIDLISNRT
jgi:nucleoid DNA-binding protein